MTFPSHQVSTGWPRYSLGAKLAAQLELTGRSLKGQLKHADRIGARFVAIVENGSNQVSLKDMHSGEQRELTAADVIPAILRGDST